MAAIPMGWLSAASLFQRLRRRLGFGGGKASAHFNPGMERRRGRPLPLMPEEKWQAWIQRYLGDPRASEIAPESAVALIDGTVGDYGRGQREACAAAGAPRSGEKAANRRRQLIRMGAAVNGGAERVGASTSALVDIGRFGARLLAQREVSAKSCLVVLGRLARAFEFRRPQFAALNEVRCMPGLQRGRAGGRFQLEGGPRTALIAAACLLPAAFTDARAI